MTEGDAAPAAVAGQGSRNLLMRVVAGAVLAPVAIAIAYAGGWLWTTLVTLAAIGLYIEWLTIVGATRETRVVASGAIAVAIVGFCLALGRIDAAIPALALGLAVVALAGRSNAAMIAGNVLLVLGIVEGALLIGWRLAQLPKSQALEFLLVSPLRPPLQTHPRCCACSCGFRS